MVDVSVHIKNPQDKLDDQNLDEKSNLILHSLPSLSSFFEPFADLFGLIETVDQTDNVFDEDDDNAGSTLAIPTSPKTDFHGSTTRVYKDLTNDDDDLVYFEDDLVPDGTLLQSASQGNEELVLERIQELRWSSKDLKNEINRLNENELSALHLAARYNHDHILKLLLQADGDINVQGSDDLTPLHVATKYNMKEAAIYLVQQGANVNLKSKYGTTALLFAARRGNASLVQLLLEKSPLSVNTSDNSQVSPLHAAMYGGDKEVVKILLKYGATIDDTDIEEDQPIHYAAEVNNSKIIECLVDAVTSRSDSQEVRKQTVKKLLDAATDELNTPLHVAASRGHSETVRTLLSLGSDIDSRNETNQTPLHMACTGGHLHVVQFLLENEAFVDAKDQDRETPLHKASEMGHLPICQFLLESGATLDCNDKDNFTPLMMAVWKGQDEVVRYLIDKGANIYVKDMSDKNVLHLAIEEDHESTLKLLFETESRSLIDQPDKEFKTPLYYAAKIGNKKATKFLLHHGGDAEFEDDEEKTPIHAATESGKCECVSILGKYNKESVNYQDISGKTPLHFSAIHGHKHVCEALIEMGAEISARDNVFWTPLDYAALHGHPKIVNLLLENDAQIDAADKYGTTPLHHASINGHVDCINILLDHGASIQHRNNPKNLNCFDLAVANLQVDACMAFIQHKRWKEVMNCVEKEDGTHPMEKLIAVAPSVAEVVLDKCIYHVEEKEIGQTKVLKTIYDFEFLDIKANKQINKLFFAPANMVKHEQDQLLSHKLTVKLISDRWSRLGYGFYVLNMLSYLVFLGLLTAFFVVEKQRFSKGYLPNSTNSIFLNIGPWFLLVTCFFHIGKEIFQIYQLGTSYLQDVVNYLEIVLYVATLLFVFPIIRSNLTNDHSSEESTQTFKWLVGSLTILLGWSNLLLYLKRFPFFGLYVVMFVEVFKSLISVLPLFSIFIIGFALSFYVLMSGDAAFQTVGRSIMKTGVMTIGEFEFNDIFIKNYNNTNVNTMVLTHPSATFLVFIIFIVLMSILTMNFLVGLAVGDIESVRKNAYLRILKAQVGILKTIQMKYPKWYLIKKYKPIAEEVSRNNSSLFHKIRLWFKRANYDFVLEEQDAELMNEKKAMTELSNNQEEMKLQMSRLKKVTIVLNEQQKKLDKLCKKLGIDFD